jgi:hypothetical protein
MNRRIPMRYRHAVLVTMAGAALAGTSLAATPLADSIYRGGSVLTMNDAAPAAEAVAVRGGRIAAVGSEAEVMKLRGKATKVVDLAGRTLLPGFIDGHGHVSAVGMQASVANLLPPPDGGADSIAAVQRTLRAWAEKNAATVQSLGLIVGLGYDDSQLAERRHPNRDDLDAVSKDIPVILVHQSGHLGAANSKALELVGITAATKDPVGGVIRRRPGSQEPDGVLEENAAFPLFFAFAGKLSSEQKLATLLAGARTYASYGYTTAQDGHATLDNVAVASAAAGQGQLPIDVAAYVAVAAGAEAMRSPYAGPGYRGHYRIGGVKLLLDGSPQGKTAWLSRPYFVPPPGRSAGYAGYASMPAEKAMAYVDQAYANGWQLLAHANGDAAADLLIAAVREAEAKHPGRDLRPVMVHAQTVREDQLDAMKELGIMPSFFPSHTFYWGDWHRDSVLGPKRAEFISPTASAFRRGMLFTAHHDAPVTLPNSLRVLSATVTRRTRSGDILGAGERVPVEVALKALTLWAAYQHFEEKTKGSIEVGKLADLVVLSANPLAVPPEQLMSLRVMETIKEGVTVYEASPDGRQQADAASCGASDVCGAVLRQFVAYAPRTVARH